MNEDIFIVFRKFKDIFQAKSFTSFLDEKGIEFKIEDNSPTFDVTFSGNQLKNEILVKIRKQDYAIVNDLFDTQAESLVDEMSQEHYLFQFSNQELYEILLKPDEWSKLDHRLAIKILNERGEAISRDFIESLNRQRIEDLSKPEKGQKTWIYVGYFLAFFGGLLGIFIGWNLWTLKKTLPDGRIVFTYCEDDRVHGKNIFIIGCIILPIMILYRILGSY